MVGQPNRGGIPHQGGFNNNYGGVRGGNPGYSNGNYRNNVFYGRQRDNFGRWIGGGYFLPEFVGGIEFFNGYAYPWAWMNGGWCYPAYVYNNGFGYLNGTQVVYITQNSTTTQVVDPAPVQQQVTAPAAPQPQVVNAPIPVTQQDPAPNVAAPAVAPVVTQVVDNTPVLNELKALEKELVHSPVVATASLTVSAYDKAKHIFDETLPGVIIAAEIALAAAALAGGYSLAKRVGLRAITQEGRLKQDLQELERKRKVAEHVRTMKQGMSSVKQALHGTPHKQAKTTVTPRKHTPPKLSQIAKPAQPKLSVKEELARVRREMRSI